MIFVCVFMSEVIFVVVSASPIGVGNNKASGKAELTPSAQSYLKSASDMHL